MKNILASRSYRFKILGLLVLSIIPLWAIVLVYILPLVRTSMYEDRKTAVRSTVDVATKVVAHYEALAESKVLTVEEAQTQALAAVASLRYSGCIQKC